MHLRPSQSKLIADISSAFKAGHQRVLAVAPTGFGKTRVAAEILRICVEHRRRALFLADLDVLVQDTHDRLQAAGLRAGYVQAGRPTDVDAPVQVASLDTIHSREFYPQADFIFLDEAHGALAASVRRTLEAYPEASLLGATATPQRGDGQPLGDIFTAMVMGPSVRQLVADGHLVPAETYSPPAVLDGALACEPLEAWLRWGGDRPAIVFSTTVVEAERIAASFNASNVSAECVTGETSRAVRDGLRQRITDGTTRVLCGVNVFLQGWDCPAAEVAILARQFSIVSTYLQACGRVLRTAPGKERARIIDLTGAALMHGLPEDDRVWSLEGDACRRTVDALGALMRCKACLAVFHATSTCPRCGASTRGCKVKTRKTRIEHQELSRLDTRPLHVRDRIAVDGIFAKLRRNPRFASKSDDDIAWIARKIFMRNNKRQPMLEAPK